MSTQTYVCMYEVCMKCVCLYVCICMKYVYEVFVCMYEECMYEV